MSTQWSESSLTPPVITDGVNVHHIIIDCSHITFIDTVGAKIIKQLVEDCDSILMTVMLAGVNGKKFRIIILLNVQFSFLGMVL